MHRPTLSGLVALLLTACTFNLNHPGLVVSPDGQSGSTPQPGASPTSGQDPDVTADASPGASGSLDTRFGTEGIVLTDVATGSNDIAFGLALQSDGTIVAAGASVQFAFKDVLGSFALVRYLANGKPDPAFGTQGRVLGGQGSSSQARGVAIARDGGILAAGWSQAQVTDFLVSRHLPNGALDPGFGTGGHAEAGFGEGYTRGIAVQEDGKILVVGYGGSYIDYNALLARFNPDGSPDLSFGSGGTQRVDWGSDDDQAQAVVLAGGKIHLAGSTPTHGFTVCRLHMDGTRDVSFGSGGLAQVESGEDRAQALAVAEDGRIVLAGGSLVMRFTADGRLDGSFGDAGSVSVPGRSLKTVAIQADGKILVAGERDGKAALSRLNANGTFDGTFGSQGSAIVPAGDGTAVIHGLAIQTDGRIVAAGKAFRNQDRSGHDDFMLMRFWP
jgi:uncharacterized delta-60 repeat protein